VRGGDLIEGSGGAVVEDGELSSSRPGSVGWSEYRRDVERVLALARRARIDLEPVDDRAPAEAGPVPFGLTDREREMVALVALGLSNNDIAGRLFLSPLTVKTHVNRAMAKLDVRDRAQLVVIAYQTGLVRAGDTESS